MASALYDLGRQGFLDGSIDWDTDDIRMVLCSSAYTRNLSTHEFHSDLTGILATSGNFASKTVAAGVADGADVTFTAVAGPTVGTQLVIYKWSGASGTSRLIANIDSGTGLPVTPNGGDITVQFDNGANKIFKL